MVNVELGKLACTGLEGHFGTDLTVGARKALLHYAYKLKAGRRPIAAPRFLGDRRAGRRRSSTSRSIATTEAVLAQEADAAADRRTSQLATHAVLVYLAELEFLGVVPRQTC